ncbi:LysR family transcriptional regulator [Polaromonas sp. P2-4]|nr:LysR family transcriptional regulator [Polaromonas sp. P2-4]
MNFRQLDLNLLRVLAAIHRTGSVTQAGKALSLSQPATSNALARLRDFLKMSFCACAFRPEAHAPVRATGAGGAGPVARAGNAGHRP